MGGIRTPFMFSLAGLVLSFGVGGADASEPGRSGKLGSVHPVPAVSVTQKSDEFPAVAMCSKNGGWVCKTGTCVQVDSSSGQCCPAGYPNYSRVGFCKR